MNNIIIKIISLFSLAQTIVVIENGKLKKKRGKVSGTLLNELSDLISAHNIKNGCLLFTKNGQQKKLKLIGIPDNLNQRFRNVWNANYK